MADDDPTKTEKADKPAARPATDRQRRLSDALRENLRRRRAQSRDRNRGDAEPGSGEG